MVIFCITLKKEKKITNELGIDEPNVGVSKCIEKGINAKKANLEECLFSDEENFDFIILAEVIEHIADCEQLLLKIKKRNSKGVIVTIPNMGYLWYRLRYLAGRFPIDESRPPNTHVRFWTKRDFIIWTKQLGYRVIQARGCGGFPILWRYFPSLFSRNNLYLLDKNDKQ